jgi:hypothetical protein
MPRIVYFTSQNPVYNDLEGAQPELERELRISRLGLVELLQTSDVVTLHVPLTEQTRHLNGRRELSHMKTTALIINTCRGQVIDEQALTSILEGKQDNGCRSRCSGRGTAGYKPPIVVSGECVDYTSCGRGHPRYMAPPKRNYISKHATSVGRE